MKLALQRASLFVGSLLFFLAIVELAARLSVPRGYFVWPPDFEETFQLDAASLKGADDDSALTINPQGMRGDPLPDDDRYQILVIGGSTTICIYLDDRDAWPRVVQELLESDLGPGSAWVGSVGRPGHTTAQHHLQLEKLTAQYPQIDAVLMLVGINDMLVRVALLRDPMKLEPAGSDEELRRAFSVFPGWDADSPWWRRTGISRFLVARHWRLPWKAPAGPLVDDDAEFVTRSRELRQQAGALLPELPGLPDGLADYAKNLNAIVDAARAARVRLIFLTQPTLWRDGLDAEENASLWMGGPRFDRLAPGAEFYSVSALAEGMARYNETLLRVCHERAVECIDAARQLPRDGTIFFDDAHYTAEGSRRLARIVADYLRAHPPLAAQPRTSRLTKNSSTRLTALSAAKTVNAN